MQPKKTLLISFIFISLFFSLHTKGQMTGKWVTGSINPNRDCEGWSIATDHMGNVYETSMVFNLSGVSDTSMVIWGSDTAVNPLMYQVVVVSNDSNGTQRWIIETQGTSFSINLVADTLGSVYLYGFYYGTMTFGSYTLTDPAPHKYMYFLAKINSSGTVEWVTNVANQSSVKYDGNDDFEYSGAMSVDEKGNPYVAGIFNDVSTTIGSTTLTNTDVSGTTCDIFVAKYDTSGSPLWAKSFGGDSCEFVSRMAATYNGDVYIGGVFYSPHFSFGGHIISLPPSSIPTQLFLAKYDTLGNAEWAKTSRGNSRHYIGAMTADNWGNVYMAGGYDDTLSFGTFTLPITPVSYPTANLIKFDSSGKAKWAQSLHGSIDLLTSGVAADNCGNVFICGGGLIDASGNDPMFIFEFDTAGVFIDSTFRPTGGDDESSLTVDNNGHVYIGGDYVHSPLIVGTDTLAAVTDESLFIAMYSYTYSYCPEVHPSPELVTVINNKNIDVFPNPATTELTISSPGKINQIIISNLIGQVVFSHEYNTEKIQVDISHLAKGMFIVKINGNEVRKFVKE